MFNKYTDEKTKREIIKLLKEQANDLAMEQKCKNYSPFYHCKLREFNYDNMPIED